VAFGKGALGSDASYSVLLRLAGGLGSTPRGYRVIGGMATHLLCREHAQLGPHIGTFDVDLALAVNDLPKEPEFGALLERVDLRPENDDRHSMYWFAKLDANRKVPVELLVPKLSDQSPREVEVAGIRAWCPPGTAQFWIPPFRSYGMG
jgi:hypothetical protein